MSKALKFSVFGTITLGIVSNIFAYYITGSGWFNRLNELVGITMLTYKETERKKDAEEAERKRLAEEAERKRLAEEEERKRLAEEEERKRLAEEEERKRIAKAEYPTELKSTISKAIDAFENGKYPDAFNLYINAAKNYPVHSASIKQNASNRFKEKAEIFIENNNGKNDTNSKILLEYAQKLNPSSIEIKELLNKSNYN